MSVVGDTTGIRDLAPKTKLDLEGLLCRIREMQEWVDMGRPVTINWVQAEMQFANIVRDLARTIRPEECWKVMTILAIEAAGEWVDFEDPTYGQGAGNE